jgi:hypothetical protein
LNELVEQAKNEARDKPDPGVVNASGLIAFIGWSWMRCRLHRVFCGEQHRSNSSTKLRIKTDLSVWSDAEISQSANGFSHRVLLWRQRRVVEGMVTAAVAGAHPKDNRKSKKPFADYHHISCNN